MRVDVGAYGLHVERHPARAPVRQVVLLHGFAGTGADWDAILPALRPDSDAVTVDLLGHGASDAPDDPSHYGFDGVADGLAAAAQALGLARPVWVGYSFGARLLLHLALRRPDAVGALVLESVHPGIGDASARARRARQDDEDATLLESQGVDAFLECWHRRPAFDTRRKRGPEWGREVERRRSTNRPGALAHALRGLGLGAQAPLLDRVAVLRAPTLLVAGALDPPYAELARDLHARIPSARLALLPGVGHAPHLEAPTAFADAVLRFLEANPRIAPVPPRPTGGP